MIETHTDSATFLMGIISLEKQEQGIEKLSLIYSRGTGLKGSYLRRVLEPEVHQGLFFWYVTCGGCPGTPP